MGVVAASEERWIEPFSGLRPRVFARLVRQVEREGADVRRGRPWSLSLAGRRTVGAGHVRQFVAVQDGRCASRARRDPRSCAAWVPPVAGIRRGAAFLGRDDGPHRRAVPGDRRRTSIG
ncbi:hypothetical protein GCM10010403_51230 [Glycomyces rutgersensis]|uniref:Uncharacterized protein n=1 Tax=Glycomyces rutgersensis TaxID=58115 RepID=A0ABP5TIA0_9ACTN